MNIGQLAAKLQDAAERGKTREASEWFKKLSDEVGRVLRAAKPMTAIEIETSGDPAHKNLGKRTTVIDEPKSSVSEEELLRELGIEP